MEHHRLDPYPIPKDKTPLCINEPWLIDKSLLEYIYQYEDGVPMWNECILDCGYDTGHMELLP